MPFDAGSIVARMKLDKSQFTAGLAESQVQVKKWDALLGSAIAGGAIVAGIATITAGLFALGKEGAPLKDIETSFNKIARSAGISGDAILRVTRAAAPSLTNKDIEVLANQLDLIGVSMDRLPQLAATAESVAGRLGKSTKEVLQQLVDGTARTSDRMVRLIGIHVQFTDKMTEEQKQAKFLNDVLNQGSDIIKKMGDNTESATAKFD